MFQILSHIIFQLWSWFLILVISFYTDKTSKNFHVWFLHYCFSRNLSSPKTHINSIKPVRKTSARKPGTGAIYHNQCISYKNILFTIKGTYTIKFLEMNFIRSMQDLYGKYYKTLLKGIKEVQNKWRDIICYWVGRFSIVKIPNFPN